MRKYLGRFAVLLVMGALVAVPSAALAGYKVPKPSGGKGTTKKPSKSVGKKIQDSTCKQDQKGLSVKIHEKAGKLTATLKHGGTKIGGGSVKYSAPSTKTLKITFNSAGRKLLKSNKCSGAPVTLKMTFKPKKGSSSTSSENLKLG